MEFGISSVLIIYRNSSNEGLKLSSVRGQTLFSSFRNTFHHKNKETGSSAKTTDLML